MAKTRSHSHQTKAGLASGSGLNQPRSNASSSTFKSGESTPFKNHFAAMLAASDSDLDLDQSSLVSNLRPSKNPFQLQPSQSALVRMRRNDWNKRVQAGIDKLQEKYGMSIKDLRTSHKGLEIDLTVPSFAAAGKVLGISEHLVNSSQSTKGVDPTAVLRGDCEAALGEQNGFDLTVEEVLKKHNKARYHGRDGENSGYTRGSLGTTVNSNGKVVDAAYSKAQKNMHEAGKTGLKKIHDDNAWHFGSLISSLVRDEMYGIQFIDANDRVLDHSGLSNDEFKALAENDARGIRIRDPKNFDRFLLHAKRVRDERKKKGNKKAKKVAIKKVRKITRDERKNFKRAMLEEKATLTFDGDRFDELGILDMAKHGPKSKRRKLAGYQFKIRNDDDSFEFE